MPKFRRKANEPMQFQELPETSQLTEMVLERVSSLDQREAGAEPEEIEDQMLGGRSLSQYQNSQLEDQLQKHNRSRANPYRSRNQEDSWQVDLSWDT